MWSVKKKEKGAPAKKREVKNKRKEKKGKVKRKKNEKSTYQCTNLKIIVYT